MADEFLAIFHGKTSCCWCFIKIEGNTVFRRAINKLIFTKWIPLMVNLDKFQQLMYRKLRFMDLDGGLTDKEVRWYPYDIHDFTLCLDNMNTDALAETQRAQNESDFWQNRALDLEAYKNNNLGEDMAMEHFKKQFDYYKNLSPVIMPSKKEKEKK